MIFSTPTWFGITTFGAAGLLAGAWLLLDREESKEANSASLPVESIVRDVDAEGPEFAPPSHPRRLAGVRRESAPEVPVVERSSNAAREMGDEYAERFAAMPARSDVDLPVDPARESRPENAQEVEDPGDGGPLQFWYGVYGADKTRIGVWRCWSGNSLREVRDYRAGMDQVAVYELDASSRLVRYVPRMTAEGIVVGDDWRWYGSGAPLAALHWKADKLVGPAIFFDEDGGIDSRRTRNYVDETR